jgi:hypothetical protein
VLFTHLLGLDKLLHSLALLTQTLLLYVLDSLLLFDEVVLDA